jgi:hypothetical protein
MPWRNTSSREAGLRITQYLSSIPLLDLANVQWLTVRTQTFIGFRNSTQGYIVGMGTDVPAWTGRGI